MCDFEKSLSTAIKNNLKEIELRGCYFHYSKSIYKQCKDYHLFIKDKKGNYFNTVYFKNISLYTHVYERILYKKII